MYGEPSGLRAVREAAPTILVGWIRVVVGRERSTSSSSSSASDGGSGWAG